MSKRISIESFDFEDNIGSAHLFRRHSGGNISFVIRFKNVKPIRYEKSTGLTDVELARDKARELILKEYNFRLERGTRTKAVSINRILNEYIKECERRVVRKIKGEKGRPWNQKKADDSRYKIDNHIRGYKTFWKLERLTKKKVQDWVDELRFKGLTDKTISNIRVVYYDLSRFVVNNSYCPKPFPKFPKLYIEEATKDADGRLIEYGFASCSIQEYKDADNIIVSALKNNNFRKQSDDEHNMFVMLRWIRILMDTGMRPILPDCPLYVDRRTDNFIFFKRYDKTKYTARGQQTSMKAVDELEEYYKSNGINNESLIVNKYGYNYTDGTIRTVKTNITKRIGWFGKTDSTGRSYAFYSIRHCHINHAIEHDEALHLLAKRVGNSIDTIMKYYYKHNDYDEYDTPTPVA